MASVANINDVLEGHVALEVQCVDRLVLNAYVPRLQVPGQVASFLSGHLGQPIPSPALLGRIGNRFRAQTRRFVATGKIPVLRLKAPDRSRWDDRKLDHVRPHLQKAEREGRFGVVALVAVEELRWVWSARNRARKPGAVWFEFFKERRRVGVYYFYILDPNFGPGFIQICTYAPYAVRVWLNGHEWVKCQARYHGIGYTELENGFASCSDPARLQALCDLLSPAHVQAFFDRWIEKIPTPLSPEDRAAGYWWELSMRQVEISRTLVLDDPRRARSFFEALVQDNIGIGRPEEVSMLFVRGRGRPTQHPHGTRIFSAGSEVRIDFRYKHSRVKQYLKGGRALRIETVINNPSDLGVARRLQHLPELIDKARQINQRLLMIEQAGQSCAIGSALFERIHLPYNREGQRTGALRFGDSRAMALAGALCHVLEGLTGFTNKTLRGLVAAHLGRDYSQSQMSYDLRRLRLHGLIHRVPRRNTYQLTSEGIRVTVFYTKLQNRLLRPLLDANKPPAPIEIRRALTTLEHAVAQYIQNARLAPAP
jgi:DNA-binding transcriptional ArsR family regulator